MNKMNKPAELSYYGLYLLSYLKENHPDKAGDAAFIEARADHVYERARLEGYLPEGAHELAMAALLEGLHFSKYNTVIEVLWNECADEVPQSEAPAAALKLLPYLEGVFARYPLSDDFAYSPEYEQLCTELTGAVLISLKENGL